MSNFVSPEILSCGYFNCAEKFGNLKKSPKRHAKGIEIELYTEDGYSTFINGEEYRVLKNYVVISKENSERYSLLPFKTVFLKLKATGELERLLNNLPEYFPSVHTEQITEILGDIILLNEQREKNELVIAAKIFQLVDFLIKDSAFLGDFSSNSYPQMHEAKKYIEHHYSEKLSTVNIASAVNLSESRFRFLFGKTYGISPWQYLTDIRLSNAKQMLWDDEFTISEIAEKCGFGCQQYFNDIFKKETGTTPGKYKKEFARRYND